MNERLHCTGRAFEQTAMTIVQVGQQGVIASLLRAEANALRIEACNEALTELISLFNVRPKPPGSKFLGLKLTRVCATRHHQLEEIVDVRRWQTDSEVARVRDHQELLSMGHRIESGNAAINRELAQQGDAIAQVLRGIHVRPLPILLVFLTLRVVCSCVCAAASIRISMLVFRMCTSTGKHLRSQYR
jgi:hypothetical protein